MDSKDNIPSAAQLEEELKRERYKREYAKSLSGTVFILVIVAAVAVLISSLLLPVLQVSGDSMTPTLSSGNIIVLIKTDNLEVGDLCSFSWNNKTLIKRIVAVQGDWVEIDSEGTVYVNDVALDEPYVSEKDFGECDISFPFQVPENSYFVLGDHRETSIDSRSSVIGCVNKDQIIGEVWAKIYPFNQIGLAK